jgi:hypothetical protein
MAPAINLSESRLVSNPMIVIGIVLGIFFAELALCVVIYGLWNIFPGCCCRRSASRTSSNDDASVGSSRRQFTEDDEKSYSSYPSEKRSD